MNNKDAFFNALIRYIDCRIDEKIADRHDSDETALGLACETSAAKDDLSKALGDLSMTLFFG